MVDEMKKDMTAEETQAEAVDIPKETSSSSKASRKKLSFHARNRLMAIVGALILIFAAIGFVTTIVLTSNWVIAKIENQDEKDRFADYIYPLVLQDPPAFDSVSKLSQNTMLAAGVWNFIMNADTSKYEKDEFGFMTVPQSDIEVYTTMLFGEGLTFEHQSIGDAEFSFTYNEENGTYNIPDSALFFSYVPRVTQITNADNQIRLRVEYVSPDFMRSVQQTEDNSKVVKVMEYVLEETKSGYKIVAVETVLSGNSVSSGSSSSSSSSGTSSSSSSNSSETSSSESSSNEMSSTSEAE